MYYIVEVILFRNLQESTKSIVSFSGAVAPKLFCRINLHAFCSAWWSVMHNGGLEDPKMQSVSVVSETGVSSSALCSVPVLGIVSGFSCKLHCMI